MPRRLRGDANKIFAERLKERREQLGLDKIELGRRIGTSHAAIVKFENGDAGPSIDSLMALAEALNCTADYLLGRTNMPDYLLIKGEQVPKDLREKGVDAVEILRSQVLADGGLTEASRREITRIANEARILRHSKPRQPKPDQPISSENPPD